jgi:microcystin-dependent protein
MSDPFVGEIRFFGGSFAPLGWESCDGQMLQISQYDVLYTLIGTTYGGDGQTTFALPDLRGRLPIHTGGGYPMGQSSGSETVPLIASELPAHTHQAMAQSEPGNQTSPANGVWAPSTLNQFSSAAPNANMHAQAIGLAGQSMPHDNVMPFLTATFIIATVGIYPSQS